MVFQKYIFSFIILLIANPFFCQKFGFEKVAEEKSHKIIPFSLENTPENLRLTESTEVSVKRITPNWIYISCTPKWIENQLNQGNLKDFYFEYNPAVALDDTARVLHKVNPVHDGLDPLVSSYTGKDVIIGIVDQGLDHNHPDFIGANGNKRLIRYWDQSITNPSQSPAPYNYGQIWYPSQINNGTITSSEETTAHGTTVTGIATGNGRANGKNRGMAPEADIIVVETNFNLPNWSLTVADACDFIFSVADSLNKPAIVNLSVGSYYGSHDGTDPAAQLIDILLDEKKGRLVICAAGNSGKQPAYHVRNDIDGDTSFVWFENNPNGRFGNNTIFFDLWSDNIESNYFYSFGANDPNNNYSNRAKTTFRHSQSSLATTIYDTLRNVNGDQLATIEVYTELMGNNLHLQGFISSIDSTAYYYSFSTTGSGSYDLWSGTFSGFNHIVNNVPPPFIFPPIVNYAFPDTLQSIVSSWNCSPKVISVGNIRNRLGHIDKNGNQYYPANDMTSPGNLAPSSSKGPTRKGIIKPDITASGDVTLASGPLWMLNNSSFNNLIDVGGYHVRNGGTSMASPTVAGIAALYLERCGNSSWQDFQNDLYPTAKTDSLTGNTPNNAYGYGEIDAFALLVKTNGNLKITGDTVICETPVVLSTNESLNNYYWSDNSNSSSLYVTSPDTIHVTGTNNQGCFIYSDTVIITQGSSLPNPTISVLGASLIASNSPNYQWFLNDVAIQGETGQVLYPNSEGYYSVAVSSSEGCYSFSNAVFWTLSLPQYGTENIKVYPNPAGENLNIEVEQNEIKRIRINSVEGKLILEKRASESNYTVNVSSLTSGTYILEILTNNGVKSIKFLKE